MQTYCASPLIRQAQILNEISSLDRYSTKPLNETYRFFSYSSIHTDTRARISSISAEKARLTVYERRMYRVSLRQITFLIHFIKMECRVGLIILKEKLRLVGICFWFNSVSLLAPLVCLVDTVPSSDIITLVSLTLPPHLRRPQKMKELLSEISIKRNMLSHMLREKRGIVRAPPTLELQKLRRKENEDLIENHTGFMKNLPHEILFRIP